MTIVEEFMPGPDSMGCRDNGALEARLQAWPVTTEA